MSFLSFQGITKRFPGVMALDDVTFDIEVGVCHALMGENGAGKSTLGRILAGVYRADAGKILLEAKQIDPSSPLAARRLGIAMVHQELAFCPNLSIAENICLGELPENAGFLNRRAMRERAHTMLAAIETDFEVDRPIAELSTGQEQLVQIAAAVGSGAKIIVMDEPTSSLSVSESEHLFHLLSRLRKKGLTVIYVSHRMEEIFRLCDFITVLRDGRHVSTEPIGSTDANRLIQQMIGREITTHSPKHLEATLGEELLRVEDLSSPAKFENINFALRAGEVVGLAGLVGAGRSELATAIFGLDQRASGRLFLNGQETSLHSLRDTLGKGLGFLPEDRKKTGLVLGMSCLENSSLAMLPKLSRFGFIKADEEEAVVSEYIERLRVKTPSMHVPVAGLSGGNQQKIALAKWLARNCRVLIVDEPTRGVDVGAKAEIHRILDDLAGQGLAILVISSELPEILNLCRRALVMRGGKIAGELQRHEFSQANFMRLMAGVNGV